MGDSLTTADLRLFFTIVSLTFVGGFSEDSAEIMQRYPRISNHQQWFARLSEVRERLLLPLNRDPAPGKMRDRLRALGGSVHL